VLSLVIPVFILVMFNSTWGGGDDDTVHIAGARVPARAYFIGAMVAYALVSTAFVQVALSLITQRESGQLKRYRGTPVPVWTFVVATVLRVAVIVGLVTTILLLIARLAYGVDISGQALAEIAVYVGLGTVTLGAAGIAATTVANDVDTASAALPLVVVLLSFVSSIFVPVDQLPGWLAEIGRIFPLYHVAAGVQTALGVAGDTSLRTGDVAVLAVWAIASVLVAARHFRWEPQAVAAWGKRALGWAGDGGATRCGPGRALPRHAQALRAGGCRRRRRHRRVGRRDLRAAGAERCGQATAIRVSDDLQEGWRG
jgi:ABC-2 type transport system permease protein